MNMIDTVAEFLYENHRVDALPNEMTGIKIEPELFFPVYSLDCLFRSFNVISLLLRMNFMSESYAMSGKMVKNWTASFSEQFKSFFVSFLVSRRKYVP